MSLLIELIGLAVGRTARLFVQIVRPVFVQLAVQLALELLFTIIFRPVAAGAQVVVAT